jgi:hypothetical protein
MLEIDIQLTVVPQTDFFDVTILHVHICKIIAADVINNCDRKKATAHATIETNRKFGPDRKSPGVGGGESM